MTQISLELLRREMAGDTPSQLLDWLQTYNAHVNETEGLAAQWKLQGVADALADTEPLRYIVDQMIAYPSLGIVYGGPGSLKSMILADLAVCVAAGKRWLEMMPNDQGTPGVTLATTGAPVLWIDADNGPRRTNKRIAAMVRGHQLPHDIPLDYVSMPVPALDASSAQSIDALISLVKAKAYRMVVIDNLGLITGNTEENSAGMANVMGRLRRLAEESECAVLIIHHQRKSASNGDASGIRKGESLRGHSSIEAALDISLLVERRPGSDLISIIPTKVRDYLPFVVIGARFTYSHFDGTRELETARFFSAATQTAEETAEQLLRTAILDEVKAAPGITQKELVDNVRDEMAASKTAKAVGVNKVRGTIKQMCDDGLLSRSGNPQSFKFFVR